MERREGGRAYREVELKLGAGARLLLLLQVQAK